MSVSVILPFQAGAPLRARALDFTRRWWAEHHPDWQVGVGEQPEGELWSKGVAVRIGLEQTDADVLVLADSDSIVANAADAVARIEAGAPWVVPHQMVHRLTNAATERVIETGELAMGPWERHPYVGCWGGGIVVISRAGYVEVGGFDPAFRLHGHEDLCFGWCATTLLGEPARLTAPLIHLYHERAPQGGQQRPPGIVGDYRRARRDPEAMAALVAPNRAALEALTRR